MLHLLWTLRRWRRKASADTTYRCFGAAGWASISQCKALGLGGALPLQDAPLCLVLPLLGQRVFHAPVRDGDDAASDRFDYGRLGKGLVWSIDGGSGH